MIKSTRPPVFTELVNPVGASRFAHQKSLLNLPFYYFLTTLAVYLLVFRDLPEQWPLLSYGALICTFPPLARLLVGDGTMRAFYLAIALLGVGLALGEGGLWVVAPLALLGCLLSLLAITVHARLEARKALAIVGVTCFSFIGAYFYFGLFKPYINVDDMLNWSILRGASVPDYVFHLAVVNMILDGGLPSTGLNLAPLLNYHFLGHYFVALLVRLTGLPAFEFYYLVIGFIIIPLYLYGVIWLLQILLAERDRYLNALVLLPVILFGLYGRAYEHWTLDVSMALSSALIMFFFVALLRWPHILLMCAILLALFLSKVSTGAVFIIAYMGVVVLSCKGIARKLIELTLLAGTFALGYSIGVNKMNVSKMTFDPYDYYDAWKSWIEPEGTVGQYVWQSFGLALITLGLALIYLIVHLRRWERLRDFLLRHRAILLMTLAIYSASVLATMLTIDNANHRYFVHLSGWISVPWICIVTLHLLPAKPALKNLMALMGLLGIGVFLVRELSARSEFYAQFGDQRPLLIANHLDYYRNSPSNVRHHPDDESFRPYFDALRYVADVLREENYLVEIPRGEADFWYFSLYHYPLRWTAFYIPAFSGKPAYGAYDAATMKGKQVGSYPVGAYGYYSYANQPDEFDYCDGGRYDGRYIIRRSEGRVVIESIACGESEARLVQAFP